MTEAYNTHSCYADSFKIKNKEKTSYTLIFRYALVYVISFTVGLISYYIFDLPFSDTLNGYVTSYFSTTFDLSASIYANITRLITLSYSDIRCIALIFVAGFTMFSSVAIYSLLCYHALSLGLSALYLVNTMSAGALNSVTFFDLIAFIISNAAVCSILILFSARTRIFNDEFRTLAGRTRLIIRSKPLYIQILSLLTVCGAILLINIINFIFNVF